LGDQNQRAAAGSGFWGSDEKNHEFWVISKTSPLGFMYEEKPMAFFVFLQKTSEPCLCIETGYLIYLRTTII
jgi:hypothetical protein